MRTRSRPITVVILTYWAVLTLGSIREKTASIAVSTFLIFWLFFFSLKRTFYHFWLWNSHQVKYSARLTIADLHFDPLGARKMSIFRTRNICTRFFCRQYFQYHYDIDWSDFLTRCQGKCWIYRQNRPHHVVHNTAILNSLSKFLVLKSFKLTKEQNLNFTNF